MFRTRRHPVLSQPHHAVDAEGELIDPPSWLRWVWVALLALLILEAFGDLRWIGGPAGLYGIVLHDALLGAATVMMLARAWFEPTGRRAWTAFGLAMGVWCVGSVAWSAVYGDVAHPPYPTFADVFWLAWYPLMVAGIVYLIRVRVHHFELHRWMDGIAVTLIVLVAGFALIVQPVAEDSSAGWLATVVDFSYPVLDVLLVGAVLGVYGLLGWRPDGMWILIGAGILSMAVADAEFAVQQARGVATGDRYDYLWTLGALLIAYAAWVPTPRTGSDHLAVTGMRAVALALIAQVLAIGIQVYAVFHEVGRSERVVTILVLVVASAQIILTRPRAGPIAEGSPEGTTAPGDGGAAPSERRAAPAGDTSPGDR
jgi:hypothetical protein